MNGMRNHVSIAIDPIPVSRGNRAQTVAACCLGVLVLILMISGFITECAGLSHTRHSDEMQRNCPSNYWNSAAGVLSLRAIVWVAFAVAGVCFWISDTKPHATLVLFFYCLLLLPVLLANTALTAQAWDAVNCTKAMMESNRDADPLIAAGSSILMLVDWIMFVVTVVWVAANFQTEDLNECCCDPSCCCGDCDPSCCGDCEAVKPCFQRSYYVYWFIAFIVYAIGLAYAYNKSGCPSTFWPFAMAVFFVLSCCQGGVSTMVFDLDEKQFKKSAPVVGPVLVLFTFCFAIATFVIAASALQSDGCKAAMGNDGATGPLLSVGAIMLAILGLVFMMLCACRCIGVFCGKRSQVHCEEEIRVPDEEEDY